MQDDTTKNSAKLEEGIEIDHEKDGNYVASLAVSAWAVVWS